MDGVEYNKIVLGMHRYHVLALRTCPDVDKPMEMIDQGILGLIGEVGELANLWEKHKHQGHPLNRKAMVDELGDAMWYLAETAFGLGKCLGTIATDNIEKLERRYPEGEFSTERSVNRDE